MKHEEPNMRLYIAASSYFTQGHGYLSAYGLVVEIPDNNYEHWGKMRNGGDVALVKIHALLRVLQQLTETENQALKRLAVIIDGVDLQLRLDAKAAMIRTASNEKRLELISSDNPEVRTSFLWNMVPDRPIRNAESKVEKLLVRRAKKIAQSKRLELIAFLEEGNVIDHGEILDDGGLIEVPQLAPVQIN